MTVRVESGPKRLRSSAPGPKGRIRTNTAHLNAQGSLNIVDNRIKIA
jgi:hypothetical protein